MNTQKQNVYKRGTPAAEAKAALVMIHGRGGTAQNIASLAKEFDLPETAIYAPQANNNTWYPYSFMAPDEQNQPELDVALKSLTDLVAGIEAEGIPASAIYFLGFSQGACLSLEFVGANAKRYGGGVAYTGGLIGEELDTTKYKGDLAGTPILITTGDPDPHVPLQRVHDSVDVLKELGGNITLKVYQGRPHTITRDEVVLAQDKIFAALQA